MDKITVPGYPQLKGVFNKNITDRCKGCYFNDKKESCPESDDFLLLCVAYNDRASEKNLIFKENKK